MSKTYRMAIVGVGAIGQLHAKAVGPITRIKLVAGSTLAEEVGRKFAATYSANYYKNYIEMLDREKPDLVSVCTPSGAHLEPTIEALKRGIHVLCEKPIEIKLQRIDQMLAAARSGKAILGGIFPQRYNPVLRVVHEAAQQGRFGNVAVINSYVPWWRDDAYYGPGRWQGTLAMDGGGAMMNQSIHGVDMVQWLAHATMPDLPADQNPVEEVFAYTAKRAHDPQRLEVEDTAVAVLRFKNGALGQLLGATSMYPGSLKWTVMAGRDGTAEVREDELVKFAFREARKDDEATLKRFTAGTQHGGGAADPMAIDYGMHTRNIEDFIRALDAGAAPAIDGAEARKAVAIITAIYESAASGQAVKIR
jgi:predicted dehydrogenase